MQTTDISVPWQNFPRLLWQEIGEQNITKKSGKLKITFSLKAQCSSYQQSATGAVIVKKHGDNGISWCSYFALCYLSFTCWGLITWQWTDMNSRKRNIENTWLSCCSKLCKALNSFITCCFNVKIYFKLLNAQNCVKLRGFVEQLKI